MLVLTLLVIAGLFGLGFARTGNEFNSGLRAAIPVGSGLLAAALLGRIDRLSNKRWQIYAAVLLLVAVFLVLRIYRVF